LKSAIANGKFYRNRFSGAKSNLNSIQSRQSQRADRVGSAGSSVFFAITWLLKLVGNVLRGLDGE
jgi:hypothetical protein